MMQMRPDGHWVVHDDSEAAYYSGGLRWAPYPKIDLTTIPKSIMIKENQRGEPVGVNGVELPWTIDGHQVTNLGVAFVLLSERDGQERRKAITP